MIPRASALLLLYKGHHPLGLCSVQIPSSLNTYATSQSVRTPGQRF